MALSHHVFKDEIDDTQRMKLIESVLGNLQDDSGEQYGIHRSDLFATLKLIHQILDEVFNIQQRSGDFSASHSIPSLRLEQHSSDTDWMEMQNCSSWVLQIIFHEMQSRRDISSSRCLSYRV